MICLKKIRVLNKIMAIVNSLSAKANDDYHLNISVNFLYISFSSASYLHLPALSTVDTVIYDFDFTLFSHQLMPGVSLQIY